MRNCPSPSAKWWNFIILVTTAYYSWACTFLAHSLTLGTFTPLQLIDLWLCPTLLKVKFHPSVLLSHNPSSSHSSYPYHAVSPYGENQWPSFQVFKQETGMKWGDQRCCHPGSFIHNCQNDSKNPLHWTSSCVCQACASRSECAALPDSRAHPSQHVDSEPKLLMRTACSMLKLHLFCVGISRYIRSL